MQILDKIQGQKWKHLDTINRSLMPREIGKIMIELLGIQIQGKIETPIQDAKTLL